MNKKGFTLVELLATLVILSIVVGITVVTIIGSLKNTKEKTEEAFVDTIMDAMEMYLATDAKELNYTRMNNCYIDKKYGNVAVYGTTINFNTLFNSELKPLEKSEFINPYNEDVECNAGATITVYRDDDYVYYYSINKSSLQCLKNIGGEYSTDISNLPTKSDQSEGYTCS